MYMKSARIQATNRMKRLSNDTIMNLPNTSYSHSVLNGAFAAAACIAIEENKVDYKM